MASGNIFLILLVQMTFMTILLYFALCITVVVKKWELKNANVFTYDFTFSCATIYINGKNGSKLLTLK